MNSSDRFNIWRLFLFPFIVVASISLFILSSGAGALQQESKEVSTTYRGILFRCLQEKWPDIQYHAPDRAFVPETGQNLAWDADKQAWIDTKTLECICPICPPTAAQTTPTPTPAAAETTTPKSANEPQKVEEKKEPSWWETLIPALIPSIGIGVGRERERREPRNPCAGK